MAYCLLYSGLSTSSMGELLTLQTLHLWVWVQAWLLCCLLRQGTIPWSQHATHEQIYEKKLPPVSQKADEMASLICRSLLTRSLKENDIPRYYDLEGFPDLKGRILWAQCWTGMHGIRPLLKELILKGPNHDDDDDNNNETWNLYSMKIIQLQLVTCISYYMTYKY